MSRLRVNETSSPELGELSQELVGFPAEGLVGFSCSGIGGFFHLLFPTLGPWVRMGSPSWLQAALAEVLSLWGCSERMERRHCLCGQLPRDVSEVVFHEG